MYSMMIVDDEEWVRERLKSTIDWEAAGIGTVMEAGDGEIAWQMVRERKPDIVVTDIRMPALDGLEFTRLVKERYGHQVSVILISGYNDFSYAQRAVKLGAYDYLLKPIQEDDLIGVIRRCIEEMEEQRVKEVEWARLQQKLQMNENLLKNDFLVKLTDRAYTSDESIREAARGHGIQLESNSWACIVIAIDDLDRLQEDDRGWTKELLQFSVLNICRDILGDDLGICFLSRGGNIVCLIRFEENTDEDTMHEQLIRLSETLCETCGRLLQYSVTAGIGGCVNRPSAIAESFGQAKKAMSRKSLFGPGKIYDVNNPDLPKIEMNYGTLQQLNTLINHIKNGEDKLSYVALDTMIAAIRSDNRQMYPVHLRLLYTDIANSIFKGLPDAARMDLSSEIYRFFETVDTIRTLDEVSQSLHTIVQSLLSHMGKQNESKKRKVVTVALQFVDEHYREPITLATIAGKLFHNASYFCKLFKEETGEPFQKYVMKVRVLKAKELLRTTHMKVYEVANAVGYEDERYFTKIFKEFEGVSPTQYRNLE